MALNFDLYASKVNTPDHLVDYSPDGWDDAKWLWWTLEPQITRSQECIFLTNPIICWWLNNHGCVAWGISLPALNSGFLTCGWNTLILFSAIDASKLKYMYIAIHHGNLVSHWMLICLPFRLGEVEDFLVQLLADRKGQRAISNFSSRKRRAR